MRPRRLSSGRPHAVAGQRSRAASWLEIERLCRVPWTIDTVQDDALETPPFSRGPRAAARPPPPAGTAAVKAVRFAGPDGVAHIGALEGETVRDAGPASAAGFIPSAEGWARLAAADGPELPLAELRCSTPCSPARSSPSASTTAPTPRSPSSTSPTVPVVFAKFPSSLIGPGAPIVIPREETRPDWEGEVAVVIGRRTYRADRDGAREAIGGISALNDVTGRRAQLETPLRQFTLGKSFDTFTPMGPAIASIEASTSTTSTLRTTRLGRADAAGQHARADLLDRRPDRLPLGRHDARAGRRDRDRHAERRRRQPHAAALPARGRRRRGRGRRRRHAPNPVTLER